MHQKLYQSEDISSIHIGGYLQDLLLTFFSSSGRNVEIDNRITIIFLPTRSGAVIELIVNELATNVFKFGPDAKEGNRFIVVLRREPHPFFTIPFPLEIEK